MSYGTGAYGATGAYGVSGGGIAVEVAHGLVLSDGGAIQVGVTTVAIAHGLTLGDAGQVQAGGTTTAVAHGLVLNNDGRAYSGFSLTFPTAGGATRFREGIKFAMDMAAPPEEENRATFYFPSQLVYTGPTDDEGVPFDPDTSVVREQPDPVRVACAIEYYDAQGELLSGFGIVSPTRLAILLLDHEYELIKGCAFVVVGGEKYVYRRTEAPTGLFDVGIWRMWFDAESEV